MDRLGGYYCLCPVGFKGNNCEHDIDECADVECKNNATCIDQVNGFYCICQDGFAGNVCEFNIEECDSSPCLNKARFVFAFIRIFYVLYILI